MAETGYISVLVAFVLSIYIVFASVYGAKSGRRDFVDSARNAALAIFFLLLIAILALLHSLVNLDFSLKYVAMNTSTDLPVIYRMTSLWAGQAAPMSRRHSAAELVEILAQESRAALEALGG